MGAAGLDVLLWSGWQKVFTGVGMAVAGGTTGGFLLMLGLLWLMQEASRLLHAASSPPLARRGKPAGVHWELFLESPKVADDQQ